MTSLMSRRTGEEMRVALVQEGDNRRQEWMERDEQVPCMFWREMIKKFKK